MAASYLYYYQDCTTVKIIVCHNYYREPGGEDQCVPMEIALLRKHGPRLSSLPCAAATSTTVCMPA